MSDSAILSERERLLQLVDLEQEGTLTAEERSILEQQLSSGGPLAQALAAEARSATALRALLESARVAVHPEFVGRVMAAVGRQRADRQRRVFGLAAALLVALVGATALLVGLTSTGTDVAGAAGGPLSAVGDFLATTLLAGAGLLGASWQGLGTALGRWLGESVLNMVVFGGLVVALNALLFALLRRRRATAPARHD